jgi:hypothetical protein
MMAARSDKAGSGNSGKGTRQGPGAGRGGQSRDGGSAQARNESASQEARSGPGMQGRNPSGEPDVFLDVPKAHVDEIYFDLEDLEAQLSLRSQVGNLVQITAGVDVYLGKVELDIKDVDVVALFKVRLENLYDILDRVFTTLDRNPEVLQALLKTVNKTVDDVGQTAQQALGPGGAVGQAVDTVGQVGQQAVGRGARRPRQLTRWAAPRSRRWGPAGRPPRQLRASAAPRSRRSSPAGRPARPPVRPTRRPKALGTRPARRPRVWAARPVRRHRGWGMRRARPGKP